jgi:FkbM family methyltransferase
MEKLSVEIGKVDIPAAYQERLEQLAKYRGESVEATARAVLRNVLTRVPGNLRDADRPLSDLDVAEVGVDGDGDPFIRLGSGRIFFDHHGKHRSVLMYHIMRDKTPSGFAPDTYSLGIEARRLYCEQPPKRNFPVGRDAVAVDAGAFVGYKAIAFLDALGPKGKVIAIELAPENYRLLKKNVEANGLTDRIVTHNVGIWSSKGEIPYSGSGWMQYTIAEMDGKDYPTRGAMPTDTLDSIFDRSGVDRINYLNIQVNGAELETLEGLQSWFDRVHTFRLAAMYKRDGVSICDKVVETLRSRGCEFVRVAGKGSITVVNPRFRD